MTTIFEQFVVFGTDNAGLERSLRFFQAVFLVLTSYPVLITILLPTHPTPIRIAVVTALLQLQSRVNLTRRLLRLFRFLEAFQTGWNLYLVETKSLEIWLDVLGKSCLGIFGLLESATLVDLLSIDQLEIFGPAQTVSLNYQAQFFWIIALYTSILSSGMRLLRVFAYRGVPKTGAGFGPGEQQVNEAREKDTTKENENLSEEKSLTDGVTDESKGELGKTRLQQKSERRSEVKESGEKAWVLGLRMVADSVDLVLPATAVGWVKVHSGVVGIAMILSTVITARDVWTRSGYEVQRRHGK